MNDMKAATKADPEIYTAIAKAMGEMRRVEKGGRNSEQKYDFASVDDFLAMTGPVLAQNGLFVVMDEKSVADVEKQGKFGPTAWLRIAFEFTVFHASGASLPPTIRTVEVVRNGAQSYGSAQSYALKQFLRALFLIPTGDKDDADYGEDRGEDRGRMPAPHARLPAPVASPEETLSAVTQACDYLTAAEDLTDLKERWGKLPPAVQRSAAVIRAKDSTKALITAVPHTVPDDLGNDSIPY